MIHPLPPNAVIRVQCPACRGHGSTIDRKLVPRFHISLADMIECAVCDGTGWLTDEEAESALENCA